MTPSPKQQAIGRVWSEDSSNILVNAVAGSGKTTLLMMLLSLCEHRTLFLAFNKSIQEEIQNKIDSYGFSQGKAMTIHSLGRLALGAKFRKITLSNNKNWEILKKVQEDCKKVYAKIPKKDFMKTNFLLINLNEASRIYLSNDIDYLFPKMLEMGNFTFNPPGLETLWQSFIEIRDSYYSQQNLVIDYTDMIYIPVVLNLHIPIYCTYLLLDECQDFNVCQHAFIDMFIAQGQIEKWVAVGDRNQSIYGFTGADPRSFDKFLTKGDVVEMPLDVCYRCPTSVINMANRVYDVMLPGKSDVGTVGTINSVEQVKDGSMVICRNTSPLFYVYFQLLKNNKACYIHGVDILGQLNKFMKPYLQMTVSHARTEMSYKLESMGDSTDSERIAKYYFEENMENFIILSSHMAESPYTPVLDISSRLDYIFQEGGSDAIKLCSIHRSKGLEADVVYVLQESLIPSKFAKTDDQLKQEMNLKYVARTRAKKEMYFLEFPKKTFKSLYNDQLEEIEVDIYVEE